jgi:hypothetical protein
MRGTDFEGSCLVKWPSAFVLHCNGTHAIPRSPDAAGHLVSRPNFWSYRRSPRSPLKAAADLLHRAKLVLFKPSIPRLYKLYLVPTEISVV